MVAFQIYLHQPALQVRRDESATKYENQKCKLKWKLFKSLYNKILNIYSTIQISSEDES